MVLKQVMRYDFMAFAAPSISHIYIFSLLRQLMLRSQIIFLHSSFPKKTFNMQFHLLTAVLALLCASAQAYDYLVVTALVTNSANESALECWRFSTPLIDTSEPGVAGSLRFNFNASSASYTIIPPRFNATRHNSPTPQVEMLRTIQLPFFY